MHCFARNFRSIALISLLALLTAGCGKKEFPRPISPGPVPQVQDLHSRVMAKGVDLTWSVPEKSPESALQFVVLKTELRWENRSCADCPVPDQQEVARIDAARPGPSATPEGAKLHWEDTAVAQQHAYRYQVAVNDAKGHQLSLSNTTIAKVVPPPAPLKSVTAATEQQGILIQWKVSNKDEQGKPLQGELQFQVQRRGPKGSWEPLSPVPVKADSFLDPAVVSNQTYEYQVTPMLVFEGTPVVGTPSEVVQAKAPEALPPPPPNTVWVIPSKGNLEVNWVPSDAKVAGYYVYRREGKEIIRLTASPVQKPPFVDRSAKRNAVYFYAVSSVSPAPEEREGLLSKWVEIRSLMFE